MSTNNPAAAPARSPFERSRSQGGALEPDERSGSASPASSPLTRSSRTDMKRTGRRAENRS